MTMQPVQFGALTRRQEALLKRELPMWSPETVFAGGGAPGSEYLDYMDEQARKTLGENRLSEDAFTPSENFMLAEAELLTEYEDVGGDDESPMAIIRRAAPTAALKQNGAGRLLAAIRASETFYVSDRLVQTLIRAIQAS